MVINLNVPKSGDDKAFSPTKCTNLWNSLSQDIEIATGLHSFEKIWRNAWRRRLSVAFCLDIHA